MSGTVQAKTPGGTYCFNQICHRVFTLQALAALIGREVVYETSYYDGCRQDVFNPCGLTSSGEVFRPGRPDNAASPIYPDGTMLLVYNPETRKAAVVRVNNAGPYWGRRKLDVSRATADKLGFRKRGIAKLQVMVIGVPTESEARYRQRRRYDRVPGPIGEYASLDEARRAINGFMLTASTRFAGMRPSDVANTAPQSDSENAGRGAERDTVLTLASIATNGPAATGPVVTAPDRSALSPLVPPFETAAPVRPGPRNRSEAGPVDLKQAPEETDNSDPVTAMRLITEARIRARTLERLELASLHVPVGPPGVRALNPRPEAVASAPAEVVDAPRPEGFRLDDRLSRPAPVTPAATGPDPRSEPLAQTRLVSLAAAAAPTRRLSAGRPIEILATRRLDFLSADLHMQPVLATLPLDAAADLMERDLTAGRVTLFARSVPLKTLVRQPVGRLGLFAHTAVPARAIEPRKHAVDLSGRVSEAVRWTRTQISAITDVVMREPGR